MKNVQCFVLCHPTYAKGGGRKKIFACGIAPTFKTVAPPLFAIRNISFRDNVTDNRNVIVL